MNLPDNISPVLLHLIARGSVSCVATLGKEHCRLTPDFHWDSPRAHFPFADCALFNFTVVNHSSKYDYMLSPVSTPSESATWGCLVNPNTVVYSSLVSICFPTD